VRKIAAKLVGLDCDAVLGLGADAGDRYSRKHTHHDNGDDKLNEAKTAAAFARHYEYNPMYKSFPVIGTFNPRDSFIPPRRSQIDENGVPENLYQNPIFKYIARTIGWALSNRLLRSLCWQGMLLDLVSK
jgi:hypothetical protein